MKSFSSFIKEGVHDPAKLKAIYLAGGPGSGKSEVIKHIKGDLGFKVVNSDDIFEWKMKKHDLNPKMPEAETHARDVVRTRAKELTAKKAEHYRHGRLGMIIDGTGKDYQDIQNHSEHLRNLGYDTHMIFVNTSLHVAHARNKKRERTVPEHIVNKSWHDVQSNMGRFQKHFGPDKFHVIDNNKEGGDPEALHNLHKKVRHIATKEVENPIGKHWIRSEKNRIKRP